jgi:restriction system protein
MARRYGRNKRNDPELAEALIGVVGFAVFAAYISPIFRDGLLSFVAKLFLFVFLICLLALVIYLIVQYFKSSHSYNDLPSSGRGINPLYHRTAPIPFSAPTSKVTNPQYQPQSAQPPAQPLAQPLAQPSQPMRASQPTQAQPTPTVPRSHPVPPTEPIHPPGNRVKQNYQQPLHTYQWDDTILSAIEWKRFETVTKEFLMMTGYEAYETKIGADGGVDIRATKHGSGGFDCLVQCKAWTAYTVGIKPIRELYGVMAAEKVARGMFVTSGGFTSEAEEFARGKILLVSGRRFLELIRKLSPEKQLKLLEIATAGDYITPTCPQCDVKMVRRDVKKGRNAGGYMWGCVHYPRCKQTLVYKEH